ncbi:Signal recognition particle protein [Buchnera aphidicola (Cinara kochiana kochiana)]|uniref:signal-recognition-particle GTPase n=1 Tax=Buchnera aphidicola (Cinara kochiana kochiana) TaxID=2518976 RepID=A0A451D5V5_9GAMM|nr:signal recognition particle receptor subunit alpha [Buchnera aphidicola]VFP81163.1 Signal recognition particle protein [Buchnera aphidicola (Cinara kochiana kochiana)]
MFNNLTKKITNIFEKISHHGHLKEKKIKETMQKIKLALLNADVSLTVVRLFLKKIKSKTSEIYINKNFSPSQNLIKIVLQELTLMMGNNCYLFKFSLNQLAICTIIGQPGSGKTTSTAKLAYLLSKQYKKKILVVSIDIYRPAAILQLKRLIQKTKANFFQSNCNQKIIKIIKSAIIEAKKKKYDVLLIDTVGSIHTDPFKIQELKKIQDYIQPQETLFVIDAMTGQDSIHIINEFNKMFKLSGVILTKLDSDTRGGVALSVRTLTEIPIKYIGIGEKIYDLQIFHPERIAKRILGMGDMLSLMDDIQNKIKNKELNLLKNSNKKGDKFNLNDFLLQVKQIKKIGGINSLINKLPINMYSNNSILENIDDKSFIKIEAMINSMTEKEKKIPSIIKYSRKKRISKGSGNTIQEINIYLKKFEHMKKIMKNIKTNKKNKIFEKIKNYLIK